MPDKRQGPGTALAGRVLRLEGRRALCQPTAACEIPHADEPRDVRGKLLDSRKKLVAEGAGLSRGSVIANAGEIPVGGVKLFQYPKPGEQCILIRTAEDAYVAYSQKCTHLSCAVFYSRAHDRLECPCHQGYFSVKDGSVLQGPPTRPLPRVVLERSGEELVAIRMEPEV